MKIFILLASVVIFFPFPGFAKISRNQNRSNYNNHLHLTGNSSTSNDVNHICEIEREEEFLSPQEMQTLANQITVKVTGDNNGGSGILLGKQENSYLVLTNAHVVRGVNKINLKTFDGKTYRAEIVHQSKFKKSDLALLKFQTSQNYCVPEIAKSINNITGLPVMAAGYSGEEGEIIFRQGEIKQVPKKPLKEGYQIGYSSDIEQGMSGGAIISSDGTLIGINGRSAYPILDTGYVYENGKKATDAEIQEMRKVSWGIPISTLLARVNTKTRTAYNLPRPENRIETPSVELTGWLGELEQKAKQFTVRIDSSSSENGSGVIIAKEGDIYTVLTAAHVVCESTSGRPPCPDYKVITHDGEEYPVEKSTIKIEAGVDLGILKFTVKNKTYQVATLADYNPNENDYIFTVGYPKLANGSPWRFSPGRIFDKDTGLIQTRQSDFQSDSKGKLQTASQTVSSLTGGYELVYTSITYGGMSGGAVLDSQGQVIGIHGRSEGEKAIDEATGDCGAIDGCTVQIGYSLGIPVSTFLGITKRFRVQAQKVEDNPQAPQLTKQKVESIQNATLSAGIPKGNAKASQWLERGNQLWRLGRYKEAVQAFDESIKQKPAFVYLAYYAKGHALAKNWRHQNAVTALEKAVKLKPDFVAAWQTLSSVYRNFEKPEKALLAINKAIQLQPENPNLYSGKWAILKNIQRYKEAESAINKAIEITPSSAFYNNRGILYSEQKKWNLAEADYNKAIQIHPKYAAAYNNRGLLYYKQKKWNLALADYKTAIQINPNYAYVHNNRGLLYSEQKKWDLALADLNKSIQINPDYTDPYYNRGNVYFEQKKWDLALADFNKVIQINPNYVDAYIVRGVFYQQKKKWNLALADYNKAIQINPNYVNAYNHRGTLYKEQKKWDLALADYTKVIQIDPNDIIAYYNRGLLYKEQKKWDLALADYTKVVQIDPNDFLTYNNRGNIYAKQEKWDLALADYNKAIQINPNLALPYKNRGILYSEQKKWDLALADFNKAIQIDPNFAQAYYNRIAIYSEQKKWDLALADFNKVIQINPNDAAIYYNRGAFYIGQKKWELALADFNKFIQINPNDADAYILRGILYEEQKKLDLAKADFNKAIQISPNDAQFYTSRGLAYLGKGDKQKAIEDLQQAARLSQAQGNTDVYNFLMNQLKQLQE